MPPLFFVFFYCRVHLKEKLPIELKVTGLSKKGDGVAAHELKTIEVPFTMPGDTVMARLHRKRRGVFTSFLEEIVVPSPDRIPARCAHFEECGGCRWQHIPYEMQQQIKEERVLKAFDGILSKSTSIGSIISCEDPWHYRNKMEYSFSSDAAGQQYLGLIINNSRGKVFNLKECHLPNPWFSEAVAAVREWWKGSGLDAYHCPRDRGSLRTLIVREGQRTGDRMAMLTVSGNPDYALNKRQLKEFATCLSEAVTPSKPESQLSLFLRIQQIKKGTPTQFYEMHLGGPDHIREVLHVQTEIAHEPKSITFHVSPSAFFQPNTRQSERLYSQAMQLADIPEGAVVYDLYCGTGTLGICAASRAKQVIGVELSPESALDARTNVSNNHLDNVTIYCGDVKQVLKEEKDLPKPDVVVVDPPRAGLSPDAIQLIAALKPKCILYISCNPITQAENIADFIREGYSLKALQPVDQFPHTAHIENIAILHHN